LIPYIKDPEFEVEESEPDEKDASKKKVKSPPPEK